jgi:hypothetical protein
VKWQRTLLLWGLALLAGCGSRSAGPLDQSTPEAAVHSTIAAMTDRNAQQLEQCFVAQTPVQQGFAAALGQLMEATAAFETKLRGRFGREAVRDVGGTPWPDEQDFQRFVEGTRQIRGTEATLTDSLGHVLELRCIEGAWKIVPEGPEPATGNLERATVALNQLAAILRDVAAGVDDAARYPAPQDVKADILRREETALTPQGPATTQS